MGATHTHQHRLSCTDALYALLYVRSGERECELYKSWQSALELMIKYAGK